MQLRTAALTWQAANTWYVPSISGSYWMSEGPHTVRWGALGPVTLLGQVRIDAGPVVAVISPGLALVPDGAPVQVRWSPASFADGTLTLSGWTPGAVPGPVWAPGLDAAVRAALRLLAADGTATIPIRHQGAAVTAAGLPVLPWPGLH